MKQIQTFLALLLLLFAGWNCGTENPVEDIVDTAAVEANVTGELYGDVALIEGVTLYMRVLKAGQLLAQLEFANGYVQQTSGAAFQGNLFASTQGDVGNYHLKDVEPGDYTIHITAKGYQTTDLNVTVVANQSVSVDKATLVALEEPVSHLQGLLTDAATGAPISQVHLQLTDTAGTVYETFTTEVGVFTFENLPVEQAFTLTIAHVGYEGTEVAVHPIPAAETLELAVELTPLPELEKLPPGQGLSLGSVAPGFELPDGNGKLHALADYIGNQNVVLIFYRGGW